MPQHFNEYRHRWETVRRFRFIAHDGTTIIIWDVSIAQADLRFEKTKWKGKPKSVVEVGADEQFCEGK